MEEYNRSNTGQGLGIAGLVLGIIALIISFIPCLGMWALIPGIIAIVFSAIGYSQASQANASKGILIAALILSILGTSIAGWQFYLLRNAPTQIEKFGKELQKAIDDEIDDENMEDLEDAMEELEGKIEDINDDSMQEASKAASKALKEFSKEVEKVSDDLDKEKDEK